jgi:hypothetical protein
VEHMSKTRSKREQKSGVEWRRAEEKRSKWMVQKIELERSKSRRTEGSGGEENNKKGAGEWSKEKRNGEDNKWNEE